MPLGAAMPVPAPARGNVARSRRWRRLRRYEPAGTWISSLSWRSLSGVDKNDPDPETAPFSQNLAAGEAMPYPNLASVPPPPTSATSTAERHKLNRKAVTVSTPWGPVKGKLGWLDGRPPVFSPEYEDCARIAREKGLPLREVIASVERAYLSQKP